MKKKLLLTLLAATMLLFPGCSSETDSQNETIQIALVTKMVDSPYWQTLTLPTPNGVGF